jgi:tetratricopeptide (TPR) repeat protein
MKKTAILTLLLFTLFTASAQHKQSDTLRLTLIKGLSDTAKFNTLHDLGNLYFGSQPDSAIIFDQQAYLIAKKNNWEMDQERELNNIASDYAELGDYANSILYYQKALRLAELIGNGFQIANANSNIGEAYLSKQDYQKALLYMLPAQKLIQDYSRNHQMQPRYNHLEATNTANIGETYLNLEKLDSAKYYLVNAYKKALAINYKGIVGSINNDLGKIKV